MTRAAKLSAFLCPGVGQWTAGRRALGAFLVFASITVVCAPFVRFFWAALRPPPCDPWDVGVSGCMLHTLAFAWHVSWPILVACIVLFVGVYAFAVVHANRIPD